MAVKENAFGIKHRDTHQFFAGFNPDHTMVWVDDENKAHKFSNYEVARAQANLFIAMETRCARRPVQVNKG